jgi:hypothetical protein
VESVERRTEAELTEALVQRCVAEYGDADEWRQLAPRLPELLEQSTTTEERVPATAMEVRIGGGWFYNVSDSWIQTLVVAIPVIVAVVALGTPLSVTQIGLIAQRSNNLKHISTDSTEYAVYEAIARTTGRKKEGPRRSDLDAEFAALPAERLEQALNQLQYSYNVVKFDKDRYWPKA